MKDHSQDPDAVRIPCEEDTQSVRHGSPPTIAQLRDDGSRGQTGREEVERNVAEKASFLTPEPSEGTGTRGLPQEQPPPGLSDSLAAGSQDSWHFVCGVG